MSRALAPALALALAFVGSLAFVELPAVSTIDPEGTEVPFGALWAGSSVGANMTNASVTLDAGSLLTSYDILYLNNTNATEPWYVKIKHSSSTNVNNLLTFRLGIDNGTSTTDQVVALLQALTQTEGAFVRLEPASANRIYVAVDLQIAFQTSLVEFDVYASHNATEATRVETKGSLTLT